MDQEIAKGNYKLFTSIILDLPLSETLLAIGTYILLFFTDLSSNSLLKKILIFSEILAFLYKVSTVLTTILKELKNFRLANEFNTLFSTIFANINIFVTIDFFNLFTFCTILLIAIQCCFCFHLFKNAISKQDNHELYILFAISLVLGILGIYKIFKCYQRNLSLNYITFLLIGFVDLLSLINSYYMLIRLNKIELFKKEKSIQMNCKPVVQSYFDSYAMHLNSQVKSDQVKKNYSLNDHDNVNIKASEVDKLNIRDQINQLINQLDQDIKSAKIKINQFKSPIEKQFRDFEKIMKKLNLYDFYMLYRTKTDKSSTFKIDPEINSLKNFLNQLLELKNEIGFQNIENSIKALDEFKVSFETKRKAILNEMETIYSDLLKINNKTAQIPLIDSVFIKICGISHSSELKELILYYENSQNSDLLLRFVDESITTLRNKNNIYKEQTVQFETTKSNLINVIEIVFKIYNELIEVLDQDGFSDTSKIFQDAREEFIVAYENNEIPKAIDKLLEYENNSEIICEGGVRLLFIENSFLKYKILDEKLIPYEKLKKEVLAIKAKFKALNEAWIFNKLLQYPPFAEDTFSEDEKLSYCRYSCMTKHLKEYSYYFKSLNPANSDKYLIRDLNDHLKDLIKKSKEIDSFHYLIGSIISFKYGIISFLAEYFEEENLGNMADEMLSNYFVFLKDFRAKRVYIESEKNKLYITNSISVILSEIKYGAYRNILSEVKELRCLNDEEFAKICS